MNLHDALNKEEIKYDIIHILFVPKLDGNNTEKGAIALKPLNNLIWMYDNKNMAYFISLTIQWKSTCEGEHIYTKM